MDTMIVAASGENGLWRVVDIHWHMGQMAWWVTLRKANVKHLVQKTCPITDVSPAPKTTRFMLQADAA